MCVELLDSYETLDAIEKQGQGVAKVAKAAKASQDTEITEEFFSEVAKPVAKVAKDCFSQGAAMPQAAEAEDAMPEVAEAEDAMPEVAEAVGKPSHEDVVVYGFDAEGKRVARVPKTSALMTNQNTGSPLHCIHCGRWHQCVGQPWWCGECDICGEKKSKKDRCSILSIEWLEGQGYAVADLGE